MKTHIQRLIAGYAHDHTINFDQLLEAMSAAVIQNSHLYGRVEALRHKHYDAVAKLEQESYAQLRTALGLLPQEGP